jgi:hypothetical protein
MKDMKDELPEERLEVAATTGDDSPVQKVLGSKVGNVAGRDIILNLSPQSSAPNASAKPARPPKPSPRLISRGIRKMPIPLPYWDESRRNWQAVSLDGYGFAIRNDSDSSDGFADNVVAHIEFESDTAATVPIDEAWWVEDSDEGSSHSLYISNSETKHIALVVKSNDGTCFPLSKIWVRDSHRHLTGDAPPLAAGGWRVTIELKAERFRARYYINGSVLENGDSKWSKPMTERPSAWPPEEQY